MPSSSSSPLRAALATLAFALLHSLLAARETKDLAARLFGDRFRNAFYRPFYLVQALLSFALLSLYLGRLPSRVIYHMRGPGAWALNALRSVLLLAMGWAAREMGFSRILGREGLRAWRIGLVRVPPEPEAQGPVFEATGAGMDVRGPFRFSRHPLNFLPVPFLWLSPKMTDRSLAFTLVATLYFWLGSKHEELRLAKAYGGAYRLYQASGIPFFLPRPRAFSPGNPSPPSFSSRKA